MKTSSYSSSSLAKKLGVKEGYVIKTINQPERYLQLLRDLPRVEQKNRSSKNIDLIHFFTDKLSELRNVLPTLKKQIKPEGIIWVSWPKKKSKVVTDVTEDVIRREALATGLVDVKVCAVDDIWSGLKLVIPIKDRKTKKHG
jgi:hypothetical protein